MRIWVGPSGRGRIFDPSEEGRVFDAGGTGKQNAEKELMDLKDCGNVLVKDGSGIDTRGGGQRSAIFGLTGIEV